MEKSDIVIRFIGKDKINFKELEENLPFCFDKHEKGEIIHKRHVVMSDVAILRVETNTDKTEKKIKEILRMLYPYKNYLKKLSTYCDIVLRVYLESDMAQMYFCIPQELVFDISEMSLGIEVSIFSEGLIE